MTGGFNLDLLDRATRVLHRQPSLVDVSIDEDQQLVVVGDTHGTASVTRTITRAFLSSDSSKLLFLGDYVDRGEHDIENIVYLAGLLVDHPRDVVLLRGNHEERSANKQYGFLDALEIAGLGLDFPRFEAMFEALPLAAMLREPRVFMVHGMVPARTPPVTLEEIKSLRRVSRFEDWDELTTNVLWSDPDEHEGDASMPSHRGAGMLVGKRDLDAFCERNRIDLIIRSHHPFPGGYRTFFGTTVLSVFPLPWYPGMNGMGTIAVVHGNGLVEVRQVVAGSETFPVLASFRPGAGASRL